MGYSVDNPGYQVWDPTTHKVWDVRAPGFDELVSGGWWRKPVVDLKPAWEGDEPLEFVYVEVPPAAPIEQLGAIIPVPPVDEDAADDDGADGPGPGGPGGGGSLDDVNEDDDDDPLAIEDAPAQHVTG